LKTENDSKQLETIQNILKTLSSIGNYKINISSIYGDMIGDLFLKYNKIRKSTHVKSSEFLNFKNF